TSDQLVVVDVPETPIQTSVLAEARPVVKTTANAMNRAQYCRGLILTVEVFMSTGFNWAAYGQPGIDGNNTPGATAAHVTRAVRSRTRRASTDKLISCGNRLGTG